MQYDFTKQTSILIQGAMETETECLIRQLKDAQSLTLGSWKFYTGFLGIHREPVIISRTAMGLANAAAATALALTYFAPKAVINQGIAGGHDGAFHVGDIVIAEKIVPMGAMIRPFSAKGAGISETDFTPWELEVCDRHTGETKRVTEFLCDKSLLSIAETIPFAAGKAGRGVLGSAEEWNNQLDRIALLHSRYGTTAEEMESAATAQICMSYGIPFIGIRIVSNTIVNDEDFNEAVASECQEFIMRFVEALNEWNPQ